MTGRRFQHGFNAHQPDYEVAGGGDGGPPGARRLPPARKRFRNRPRRTTGAEARSAAPEKEHNMDDNHAYGSGHRGRGSARLRRAGLLAAALACLALVAAACSSAAKTGTGAGSAGGGGSAKHSELAYSQCMRAHGITDFPDPNAQGGIDLNGGPGSDLNVSSPQFKAANNACKSLLPPQHALSPAQQAKVRAQALKYSRCMRAHGISDFPDPDSQGGIALKPKAGGDLDPNNPLYKAADKACKSLMPGGGGSNSTSGQPPGSGGGQ